MVVVLEKSAKESVEMALLKYFFGVAVRSIIRGVMKGQRCLLFIFGGACLFLSSLRVVFANAFLLPTSAVHDTKGSSKSFPKHETRHVSEHKNLARCARFSLDGRFVATGSADMSIKLFEISKIKQMMLPDANTRDGPVRPVIRTFYDHIQVILTS
ncbi:Cleavage stimulation factor subunit 50 [Vitis vinifera]|uniref:Cleavage stimulation factor 50 kDa subunit n=1 Tax=Vitis vinifera TaxID=29760 RepID=A0A438I3H7_VITVI|nr:Cleavage stimulation factor subunit 50 [Vitis vinifera]